jgi:hypothetical protein
MPVILHRPKIAEKINCAVGPGEKFIYIDGPIVGAPDFQEHATQLLEQMVPASETLHIANPRWPDIPEHARLSVHRQNEWEKSHLQKLRAAGACGIALYYAAAPNPPRAGGHPSVRYHTTSFERFTKIAKVWEPAREPARAVLGIDPSHTVAGLADHFQTAVKYEIPIVDSLQRACEMAHALLFPPAQGRV